MFQDHKELWLADQVLQEMFHEALIHKEINLQLHKADKEIQVLQKMFPEVRLRETLLLQEALVQTQEKAPPLEAEEDKNI